MRVVPIEGLDRPELQDFTKLTDVNLRRRAGPAGGLYLAESTKVIERAIAAGHQPRAALSKESWLPDLERILAPFPEVPVFVGEDSVLEGLTGFHLHRGAIASMHRPELPSPADVLRDARLVVVLEDIVDHTNVGAIFRAAAGIGADAVLVTPRCADPLYRRSVRVSMGTVLQVPWTRLPEWDAAVPLLHGAGFDIAALALSDVAVTLDDYAADPQERIAMVFGAE